MFTPDKNRSFTTARATVKTTLQPEEAQEIALLLDRENSKPVLYEAYRDTNPNQHTIPGTLPGEIKNRKAENVTPFKKAQEA